MTNPRLQVEVNTVPGGNVAGDNEMDINVCNMFFSTVNKTTQTAIFKNYKSNRETTCIQY